VDPDSRLGSSETAIVSIVQSNRLIMESVSVFEHVCVSVCVCVCCVFAFVCMRCEDR